MSLKKSIQKLFKSRFGRYIAPLSLFTLLFGLPIVVFLTIKATPINSWFDNAWEFRKPIAITYSGSTLTDYDLLIEVDTAALIAENKIQADCDDIRFIDSDDVTILPYWIESDCNTATTQIWTKVPSVPDGGKSIYMYYGSGSASNAQETWAGNAILYADSACPAGWVENTDLTNKFAMGSSSYGLTGGSSTHDHEYATCDSSGTTGNIVGADSSGSISAMIFDHYHAASVEPNPGTGILPPYLNMIACEKASLVPESSLITLFDSTEPTGWTRYSSLDGRFVQGSSSFGATGGSDTHSHVYTPGPASSTPALSDVHSTGFSTINYGDGADGAITFSASTNINTTNRISGRTCAQGGDAVNYSVTGMGMNVAVVTPAPDAGCLAVGDEVLLINLQGTSSNYANVGNYELLEIDEINGTVVTFTSNKVNRYGDTVSDDLNLGTGTTNQRVMLQRVPNYTDVTVNSGINVYPSAWNGVLGGVLAFKANGTVNVNGLINVDGLGYRGGEKKTTLGYGGYGGESITGLLAGAPGSNGELFSQNHDAVFGGGGGGACWVTGESSFTTNNIGYGSATGGAGGGGGGTDFDDPLCGSGGSGGGGGYGDYGFGGLVTSVLNDGGINVSGDGGHGNSAGRVGGGGGGGTYGVEDLSKVYFGSSGGAGGSTVVNGGNGGDSGGIILINGQDISISATGSVSSNGFEGEDGVLSANGSSGAGGGGTGGSILLQGEILSYGASLVSAVGGSGGAVGRVGGAGGNGRIAIGYVTSLSGTSSPVANISEIAQNDRILALTYHTHQIDAGSTEAGSSLPQYVDMIFAKNDTATQYEGSSIVIVDSLPPLGWDSFTPLIGNLARGANVYGATGGSDTHSHGVTISLLSLSLSKEAMGTGTDFAGQVHTHSCSTTTDSQSNIPPYIEVIYAQKKDNTDESVTYVLGVEDSNVPFAPSSVPALALSTTSIRWNFIDNSDSETGFKVYDSIGSLKTTCASPDLSYCDEIGLGSRNTQYTRKFVAYNANGDSDFSADISRYTHTEVPTLSINAVGINAITLFASNLYNYTIGASGLYFDCTDIGCDTGLNSWIQANTDTVTGLSQNIQYNFVVKARNGDSIETAYSTSITAYTLSDVPTLTAGTLTSSSIELVAANTNNIAVGSSGLYFDCISANCDTGLNSWLQTLSDIATGLSSNTQYTFQVKARNSDSTETAYSTEVSIYSGAEAPVIDNSSVLGNTSVNVVLDNVSNPATTEYALLEVNSDMWVNASTGLIESGITWGTFADYGNLSGLNIIGLTPGTSYSFKVKARNGDNIETVLSVASTPITTTIDSPVMGIPTVIDSSTIRWNFTDNDTNELGFNVYDENDVLKVTCTTPNLTYCNETGLLPNISYTRKVTSYNVIQESNYSNTATAITFANVPSPASLSGTDTDITTIITENSNSNTTEYVVKLIYSGQIPDQFINPANGSLSNIETWGTYVEYEGLIGETVTGLVSGREYIVTVKARNENQIETVYSTQSTFRTLPALPTVASLSAVGTTSLLGKIGAEGNDSSVVYGVSFMVAFLNVEDYSWSGVLSWGTYEEWGGADGFLIENLDNNARYYIKIVAKTLDNIYSGYGDEAAAYTGLENSSPPIPQDLAPTQLGFTLSVDHPMQTEEAIYEVNSGLWVNKINGVLQASESWGTQSEFMTMSGGSNGYISSLSPNTEYVLYRKARNGDNIEYGGAMEAPYISNRYTMANTPSTPVTSTVSSTSINVITGLNGNPSYTQLAIQEANSGLFVNKTTGVLQVSEDWGTYAEFGSTSGINTTGLISGTEYIFRVKAKSESNTETGYSGTSDQYTELNAPTIGIPIALSSSSIRWTFTDNETTEIGFRVLDENNILVAQCIGQDLTYCDEVGLNADVQYTRKVVAYNLSGNSPYSATATALTHSNIPEGLVISTTGPTTLKLVLGENNNPSTTQYLIQETISGNYLNKTTGELQAAPDWATYIEFGEQDGIEVINLFSNALYTFRIKSRNQDSVETAYNNEVSAYTAAVPAGTPILSAASSTSLSIVLNDGGNNSGVEFAVKEVNSGNYVNLVSKQLQSASNWGTYAQWNGVTGINILNLNVNTQYEFVVIARNSDNLITEASPSATKYTLAALPSIAIRTIYDDSTVIYINYNNNPLHTEYRIIDTRATRYFSINELIFVSSESWIEQEDIPTSRLLTLNNRIPGSINTFEIVARNGDGVITSNTVFDFYSIPAAPTITSITPTSTTSINIVVNANNNHSTVRYRITETSTGLYVNPETGRLQTLVYWGTLDKFSGVAGINIDKVDSGKKYTFTIEARNIEYDLTRSSIDVDAQMKAILHNVPEGILTRLQSGGISVSDFDGAQLGKQGIRISLEEFLLADMQINFDRDKDWSDVVFEYDTENSASVIHLENEQGLDGTYTMYVVKNETIKFRLCPDALSLEDITEDCTNGFLFEGPFPQTETIEGIEVSVSIAVLDGVTYWVVDGLTGTGGRGEGEQVPIETISSIDEEPEVEKTALQTTVDNVVGFISAGIPETVAQVVKSVESVIENSVIGELEKRDLETVVATTSVVTISVSAGILAGGFSQIPYFILQAIFAFLSLLGFRKKTKSYGYVYDSISKTPISRAIVRIYSIKNELVWTDVTDSYGSFSAELKPGSYTMKVRKAGYKFPSIVVSGKKDTPIENVYHGERVKIVKKSTVSYAVPLDERSVKGFIKLSAKFKNTLKIIGKRIQELLFVVGIILAGYTYNKYPDSTNLFVLALYIPAAIMLIKTSFFSKSKFGIVVNSKGKPVKGIKLGLKEMQFDRFVGKRITDEDGLYRFLTPSGTYQLTVLNKDYKVIKYSGGSNIVDVSDNETNFVIDKKITVTKKKKKKRK